MKLKLKLKLKRKPIKALHIWLSLRADPYQRASKKFH